MSKAWMLVFYSLLLFCFTKSIYAIPQASLTTPTQLNRVKINLGEKLCNDTFLKKSNMLNCSTSLALIGKSNWKLLIPRIESNQSYVSMFQTTYNGKITPETITDAVREYETSLIMPSRFDAYLEGNKKALTPEEIKGYQLFKSYGCAACHTGANLGGSKFKKMGVAKNYLIGHRTLITAQDLGLYEVTKNTNDVYVFSVPPLRNVSIMNSYYHDGSVKSLHDAVYLMGKYQLGIEIPEANVSAIVSFLNSLTAKTLEPHNKK